MASRQANVVSYPQKIIVAPDSKSVKVIGATEGPVGPEGPPGPTGPAGPNTTLMGLLDTDPTGLADGDYLVYDLGNQLWIPSPDIVADVVRSKTGQEVVIAAGESYGQWAAQAFDDEFVHLVGEGGVKIWDSADNWATGWTGVRQAQIADGRFLAENGTNSLPTHAFVSDPDTGIYLYSTGALGITAGGNVTARFHGTYGYFGNAATGDPLVQHTSPTPSASRPAWSFAGDSNTGMFRPAGDRIGFATGAAERVRIGAGTETSPALIISGDGNDNGFYRYGTDDIGLSLNGSLAVLFAGGIGQDERLRLIHNNTNESCFISFFQSDNASRLGYIGYPGSDDLYLKNEDADGVVYIEGEQIIFRTDVGGVTEAARFNANHDLDLQSNSVFDGYAYMNNGSRTTVAYGWNGETDTGFYRVAADEVALSLGSQWNWYCRSGTNEIAMEVRQNAIGNITTDADGATAGIRIKPRLDSSEQAGGIAGMTWQSVYSTDRHVHARVWHASGDKLGFRNYENTAWVALDASAFVVGSSQREKARIRTARTERGVLDYAIPGEKGLALGQVRQLRPVLFDDLEQETLWVWDGCPTGEHESRNECDLEHCPGSDNMRKENHLCDDFTCGGTNESPCWLIETHVDRVGLIAEEVMEVYPKAVNRDKYGNAMGIDYAVITVELLNVVQYLTDGHDEQEAKITALEAQNDSLEQRIAALEAMIN